MTEYGFVGLMAFVIFGTIGIVMLGTHMSCVTDYKETGYDACGIDKLSSDPNYYTEGQKIHWEYKMKLKQDQTQPREIIDYSDTVLSIGTDGIWLTGTDTILINYPEESLILHSGTDYYIDGKLVRNFYGLDQNDGREYTTISHSCVEFESGAKTGIDVIGKTGIITIGCEEWMIN